MRLVFTFFICFISTNWTFAFDIKGCNKFFENEFHSIVPQQELAFSRFSTSDNAQLIHRFIFPAFDVNALDGHPPYFLQNFLITERNVDVKIYYVNGRAAQRNKNFVFIYDVCVDPSGKGKFEFYDEAAAQVFFQKKEVGKQFQFALINTFTNTAEDRSYVLERLVINEERMIQVREYLNDQELVDDGRVDWLRSN